jgi:diguanylate cyclase (GGDEF)-like protein/PAS domain S-box-containing protein
VAAAFAVAFLALLFLLWKESARQLRAAEAAEASAQSSADSYRALFDSMSDAVVVADGDGQVIDANPAATALFSPGQEPLYGVSAEDLQAADPETGEIVGRRRDGSTFPQDVRFSDVDYLGNPAKIALIRDISERREAERVVRESEARYRIVAEQTGTIVYEFDIATGEVDWSGAVGSITGYGEDELAAFDARRWTELVHESDRENLLAHIDRARRSGMPLQVEYRFRHRSGEWLWLEQRGVHLTDDHGQPYRLLGSVADITERKRITGEMTWQASHDALTGLFNRQEFESRVTQLLGDRRARRSPNALLYIDLDQFKVVNDTCGHQAGDELLKQLTGIMLTRIRDTDTLARLGGDEFGLLLTDCTIENAVSVSNNLIRMVNEFRFHWDEKLFTIGASIGLVEIDDSTEDAATLFSAASSARIGWIRARG